MPVSFVAVGVISNVVITGGPSTSQAEVLNEVLRPARLAPEGNAPVKLPSSELPTRSVTPVLVAALAQDDDRVVVGRHLGLRQTVVVERDRVGGLRRCWGWSPSCS